MRGRRAVLGALFVAALLGLGGAAQAAEPVADPLLEVLSSEAMRSTQALKADGPEALYYLSYRVSDGVHREVAASFGALTSRLPDGPKSGRMRALDISTRVGGPALDNTHKMRGGAFNLDDFEPGGTSLPIQDDPVALRLALWKATDATYKRAVKRLIQVRANKEVKVSEEDDAGDFTAEPPQVYLGSAAPLTLDLGAWAEEAKHLSAIFKGHPRVIHSRVAFECDDWIDYFADSDGARIREPQVHVRLMITASVKADDGMPLELFRDFEGDTPADLPAEPELAAAIEAMATQLEALRTAPVIDPYSGPAIIAGRAAAVFFHEIFGHRMEGHRQKDADEGHTFTHKLGQAVLPKFLTVVDDPTRQKLGNTLLNGFYRYDDEGVPAQPAPLVKNGVLGAFLMERSPIHGFAKSNGHGRAQTGMQPVARQGNLIVTSSQQLPPDKLRGRLLDEVRRQNKPYGLIFEDISGGFTETRADFGMPQAFKVLPLVVKKVYPDGRPDELVRGVDLIGTPLESFDRITATGDDTGIFNGFCGAESGFVPVAAASPSLLVSDIEVDRRRPDHTRPPILPPPLHPEVPWSAPNAALRGAAGAPGGGR